MGWDGVGWGGRALGVSASLHTHAKALKGLGTKCDSQNSYSWTKGLQNWWNSFGGFDTQCYQIGQPTWQWAEESCDGSMGRTLVKSWAVSRAPALLPQGA